MTVGSGHYAFTLGAHSRLVSFAEVLGLTTTVILGVTGVGGTTLFYSQLGLGIDLHY
jgi:hypothetical protein